MILASLPSPHLCFNMSSTKFSKEPPFLVYWSAAYSVSPYNEPQQKLAAIPTNPTLWIHHETVRLARLCVPSEGHMTLTCYETGFDGRLCHLRSIVNKHEAQKTAWKAAPSKGPGKGLIARKKTSLSYVDGSSVSVLSATAESGAESGKESKKTFQSCSKTNLRKTGSHD